MLKLLEKVQRPVSIYFTSNRKLLSICSWLSSLISASAFQQGRWGTSSWEEGRSGAAATFVQPRHAHASFLMVSSLPGYVDVGLIPKGARDITIMEMEGAGNFLAIRSEDPEKYYLNGGFIIQWNGNYRLAGTVFQYDRKGELEKLMAPGPTNESVWIQVRPIVLFSEIKKK